MADCICTPRSGCLGVPGDHDPRDPKTCPACIGLDPESPCIIEFDPDEGDTP